MNILISKHYDRIDLHIWFIRIFAIRWVQLSGVFPPLGGFRGKTVCQISEVPGRLLSSMKEGATQAGAAIDRCRSPSQALHVWVGVGVDDHTISA